MYGVYGALYYSIDLSYAEGFAHRLDHAGDRYYSYDDDGNVIRERNEAMPDSSGTDTGSDDDEWDERDRLTGSTEGTTVVGYVYGEDWVELKADSGDVYLPYKFTGKERDEETGLYYYGARYLDHVYSRWLSTDPAVGEYLPTVGADNSNGKYKLNLLPESYFIRKKK